jgi:serine/threonine protein kinase
VEHLRTVAAASAIVDRPEYVPLIEVGEAGGIPFLARPYVEGEPYATVVAKAQALMPMVELLERIARALHWAHEHGSVHGNLRPANLFVAGGEPRILDAGLAPLHDAFGDGATLTARAPEQLQAGPLDARTDVYALGLLLYDLLAGRAPFRRGTLDEMREAVRRQAPPAPSERDPNVPHDLESICLCALAKDRDDRMSTAGEFADDLARWRGGKPVRAKRAGRRRWLRKLFE